jgi:CheY-like chemotaxis protein
MAQIQIIDSGIGIAPEFLPYVFDRFRQADSSTTRSYGGLGLGLAIVRHLAQLHGGKVAAENNPGGGAKFTVYLPVVELQDQEAGLGLFEFPDVAQAQAHLMNLQLLVVDDDDDSREFLIALLEDEGAMVRSATSVAEALAALETFWPDVLLSDIGMPGADGYQLIARVREMEAIRGGNMPAIALTAYAREEERQQALKAGFQMHLSKPVEINQLIDGIVNLAGRLPNAAQRHSAVETAVLTPNPLPIIEKNIKLV